MEFKDILAEYIINLYQDVPGYLYKGLLSAFLLGVVLLLVFLGIKKGLRYSLKLLFVEYLLLIYSSTVLFRPFNEDKGYNFQPFWSYTAYKDGMYDLIADNIMNTIMFVPLGLLLGCAFRNVKWWQALLIGCIFSLSIESLQFVLKRGFSETDDVIHNTLGCIVGYGMYSLTRFGYEKLSKRTVAVL